MRRLLLALTLSTALSAAALAADDYVMMKINNQDVTKSEVDRLWSGLFPAGQAPDLSAMQPDMREKILRGVMTERLILAEALKEGIDKSPAVQQELEEVKRKIVVRSYIEAKTPEISDAQLKADYDALVKKLGSEKEVRARHVLVETEAEAKQVKAKIDGGKGFDEVAREYSKDPGSAKQGGDLGYFTKEKMVKEFAAAAFGLKKGEVSAPVKSNFGWHVIKVEDVRPVTIPTFNDVKEPLRTAAQEKKLEAYIRGLVKSAEVTVYDDKGKEQPFTKEMAPITTAPKKP